MSPGHLGVDVGGTFTDVVLVTDAGITTVKVPTTPDPSEGVMSGSRQLVADGRAVEMVHGTTIATNALLERAGARVVLVTDLGFEDVIEIGRQDRPSLYDPSVTRPIPLAARDDRIGFAGDVDTLRTRIGDDGVAVAVCLAYSYTDSTNEETIRAALDNRHVSISSQVAPEFREFERTSTTVMNAYLEPVVTEYLTRLSRRTEEVAERLMVMRSSGGLMAIDEASRLPAGLLLSGPAGGVVAASGLGETHGFGTLLTFDMGGTSTDVCRIEEGRPELVYERTVDGYVVRMPSVAVHTVGAGGGSIAWVDDGGSIRVGPQSAGAEPGPVCYAMGGTEPTVTDANLVLGRIPPETLLAGVVELDVEGARRAIEGLGRDLGLGPMDTASGIIKVVNTHMERAIRTVSIEEGVDPATAVLVAFGGAGGLHAVELADALGISSVVVPPHAGVFSALGLLMSPPRLDLSRSVQLDGTDGLDDLIDDLTATAQRRFAAEHGRVEGVARAFVDMRYLGQAHEVTVPMGDDLVQSFHKEHQRRNGFSRLDDPVEVVTLRVEVMSQPSLTWDDVVLPTTVPSQTTQTSIATEAGWVDIPTHRRESLEPGRVLSGPAIVIEEISTTLLPADKLLTVMTDGTLMIEAG